MVATLPFAVRLDAFEIDYYEGTRRPAQFRSRVTVKDAGRETPAVIEMNHELAYGGYKFFQSSYRETPGRDQTILSVSKDPGEPIVFLGYYGLVAGMIIVLVTRIRERRRALQPAAAATLLALLAAAPASAQPVPPLPSPADVEALRRLPVQHDGRVMPLDTLAREAVWNVTGKRSVWGVDPVGDGPRLGLRPPGLDDPADRAREGRAPGRRDRASRRARAGPRSRPSPATRSSWS